MSQQGYLLINAEELKNLIDYSNEIPTKYGLSILKFIEQVSANRKAEQEAQETPEETADVKAEAEA